MKLKPAKLLVIATVLLVLFGILAKDKTIAIQLHDTYFIIDYFHIAVLLSLLTGVTAMVLVGEDRVK